MAHMRIQGRHVPPIDTSVLPLDPGEKTNRNNRISTFSARKLPVMLGLASFQLPTERHTELPIYPSYSSSSAWSRLTKQSSWRMSS